MMRANSDRMTYILLKLTTELNFLKIIAESTKYFIIFHHFSIQFNILRVMKSNRSNPVRTRMVQLPATAAIEYVAARTIEL